MTAKAFFTLAAFSAAYLANGAPVGSSALGNFGSCSVPQIEFAVGFDGRKETSFEPVDKKSFNHGSAQNIDIITQFMCDQLTNSCKADQTAKDTCAAAKAAADTKPAKTGAQADAFNAVFKIKTNFAAVASIDDQGRVVAGTGAAGATPPAVGGAAAPPAASGGIGNFGSCSVPKIEFGVGFDGRKETSFQPADKKSFNHGSAQNIDIITQFTCDQLVNSCKADQTAKATCAAAKAAADTKPAKTGAQADAFNAVFNIKTNFAAVASIDDQGRVVAGTGAPTQATPPAANGGAAAPPTANGIGNFGSCSVPKIEFGVGFDGRKETSFQPVDKASFNHGSAQNIDIITQFMCDQLVNSCKADQIAKTTCAAAKAAADTKPAKTGAQADAFNAVFNLKTNFAAVASIDDQGRVVAGTGVPTQATPPAANGGAAAPPAANVIGNFGSCSVPQIQFGVGFDGRKETSFQPVDKVSFNHGSAQNIDIITQFMCDQLVNSCKADQTAKATCAAAKAAADTKPAKTGAQADAFNAVFNTKTNFAAVASIDDQGRVVAGTGAPAQATPPAANGGAAAPPAANGIGNFGSCSVPQIQFGVGFDGRKETSFQPTDKNSFNHGSAQNIDIITQFMCDQLVNSCKADQTAKATCAAAKAAADTKPAKTGAQADAFNAVFNIRTNFAAVASIDDQGRVVAGTGAPAQNAPPAAAPPVVAAPPPAAANGNLQKFPGALGGVTPPAVADLGNGQFQVDGNSAFNNKQNALIRSCDVQHNKCANAANASGNKGALTVAACGDQQQACNAFNAA